jgi:L-threonylcarbamoyladenylate synthase
VIDKALKAVRSGKVVGLPTDTVYGLGVDPLNESAVARLFDLKGRPAHKPVGLLVANMEQAVLIGEINEDAAALAARYWPGALTLIVTPKVILADWVGDTQRRTVGLRIPGHDVARDLLHATGPLAVTSANRSGEPEAMDDAAAKRVFGDEVAVYLEGTSPGGVPSTVIDATTDELVILRKGPISL